ncbi:hypothetical protein CNMCM7691_006459 [Aspergillus felis]|uniref:DEAD/DEAH box helicase n=1 Tax=Aspergillus felis TaxID=1287682 RepID=A0A8H6V5X2_9EURO|nr:hypothetical protein CNMCM7691_006459 [Aspergillus felis]
MDPTTSRKRKRGSKSSNTELSPLSAPISAGVDTLTHQTRSPTHFPGTLNTRSNQHSSFQHGALRHLEISLPPGNTGKIGTSLQGFKRLSRTYRALNIAYTFFCSKHHLPPTFDRLRSAIEAQGQGSTLSVEDMARIKALIPQSVRLQLHSIPGEDLIGLGSDRNEIARSDQGSPIQNRSEPTCSSSPSLDLDRKDVILFDFVDEDGGQIHLRKRPDYGESYRNARHNQPILVYSQKQMLRIIEKRNKRYEEAVEAFVAKCCTRDLDPFEELNKQKDYFIPVSTYTDISPASDHKNANSFLAQERKSVSEILAEIREMDWYVDQIVPGGHQVFDPRPPVYGSLAFSLSQNLVNALYNAEGITNFYAHQAEAINYLLNGFNVIVSTSTNSGKSLIYHVPMIHRLEQDSNTRGLYIFPTKALAQDQRRRVTALLSYMDDLKHVPVYTFDGDTPIVNRDVIRHTGRIIFTNPDTLHVSILPQHSRWRDFLKNLMFVVVDELHVYNGLFGSHMAFIMRRLRRVCAAIGNTHIRFVSCSATVAQPEEHMKAIFGVDTVKTIDYDGSPSGRKEHVSWNPPLRALNDPTSGRRDGIAEAARLFCHLILKGAKVLAFCKTRFHCELLLRTIQNEFRVSGKPEAARLVSAYRGGYSPQERRQIEVDMYESKLFGIVATSALELGVDIASLDAVISLGFPRSVSNLRQQIGRAGRRNKDSLSIFIGLDSVLDQYFMQNPSQIFESALSQFHVDLENEVLLERHLQCAAFELPVQPDIDSSYFGEQLTHVIKTSLTRDNFGLYHPSPKLLPNPSTHVPIRESRDDAIAIIDTTSQLNRVLEQCERTRAMSYMYEGGIFLHQGEKYIINDFDLDKRLILLARTNVDWFTSQRDFTDIDPVRTDSIQLIRNTPSSCRAFLGSLKVESRIFGYFKRDRNGKIFDSISLENPPIVTFRTGIWLNVPIGAFDTLASKRLNMAAAIHAAEHALLSLMPIFANSMPGDIKTDCKLPIKELPPIKMSSQRSFIPTCAEGSPRPTRQRPGRLIFYDTRGESAGSGLVKKALGCIGELLRQALSRIESCPCVNPRGCNECVWGTDCEGQNTIMSKAGASVILRFLLGWDVDVDSLPSGDSNEGKSSELAAGLVTVIPAPEAS